MNLNARPSNCLGNNNDSKSNNNDINRRNKSHCQLHRYPYSHSHSHSHSHHLVAGAIATVWMLSFFVAHRTTHCHGFRFRVVGGWKNRYRASSFSSSKPALAQLWSQPIRTTATARTPFPAQRITATPPLRCPGGSEGVPVAATTRALHSSSTAETETSNGGEGGKPIGANATDAALYRQFRDLSIEIRTHDELYYGGSGSGANGPAPISDDAFDALVRREEELEEKHPEFVETWRIESGLGMAATRSGRVGMPMDAKAAGTQSGASSGRGSARLKRKHLSPMLSLDNVLGEEQLHGWLKRVVKATNALDFEEGTDSLSSVSIVTEPKLDGVSLSLRYESEGNAAVGGTVELELRWASTRGDGKTGQDATAAAHQMPGIPARLCLPEAALFRSGASDTDESGVAVEVRGEVVLPRSDFLRMKRTEAAEAEASRLRQNTTADYAADNDGGGEAPNPEKAKAKTVVSFSNPRNAASGILLRKESDDSEDESQSRELRSLLRFYAYDVTGLQKTESARTVLVTESSPTTTDGIGIREQLSDWGFSVALPAAITEIEWNHEDMVAKTMDAAANEDDESEPALAWDEWFREVILEEQVRPIMEYFSALETHRENLQKENNHLLSPSRRTTSQESKESKPTANRRRNKARPPASTEYEWGDFDVDGCVHKVSQARIKSAMGSSMKSPRWATAHKFPAQSAVSRLLDVVVQVGRTGALTPVAVLEPTEVGGVVVQRATLHNFGHMQEILGSGDSEDACNDKNNDVDAADGDNKDLARIPRYESVLLQRAGDVIPQVVRRIPSHAPSSDADVSTGDDEDISSWISLEPPEKCPFCSSPVSYETTGSTASSVGQVIRCSGPPLLCPPRAVTSLKHAFSRDALDLTGLSEARIQQLMDADLLRYPSDVFEMGDTEWESVASLPGWGQKSCQNLRDTSTRISSDGISLGRFIYSLGIRHVGKHTSELVAESYGSIGAFLEALDSAAEGYREPRGVFDKEGSLKEKEVQEEEEETTESPQEDHWHPFPKLGNKNGIGPVVIESLLVFARTEELKNATKNLANALTISEQEVVVDETVDASSSSLETNAKANVDPSKPWKGLRVVFTGSIGGGLTRSGAQDIAKRLGAKATPGSVSKSTDLVVCGEKGGKKLKQARDLGIPTLEADEFATLARENGLL